MTSCPDFYVGTGDLNSDFPTCTGTFSTHQDNSSAYMSFISNRIFQVNIPFCLYLDENLMFHCNLRLVNQTLSKNLLLQQMKLMQRPLTGSDMPWDVQA